MTDLEQLKRYEAQRKDIEEFARTLNVIDIDEAGMLWYTEGQAEQWGEFYDEEWKCQITRKH